MRRRLSAILATLAVAQFSLGGTVAGCQLHAQTADNAASGSQHSGTGVNCHAPAGRATSNIVLNAGMPSCDYPGSGGCVGMISCAGQIAPIESQQLAAVLRADRASQSVLGLTPRPNRAPEPPPPRI